MKDHRGRRECERWGNKYSSYIYLWALQVRLPEGPQGQWMRSFWTDTEWVIHRWLPCINTGVRSKPHLEAMAVSDARSNTWEKMVSLHADILCAFGKSLSRPGCRLSEDCTCPFTTSVMKDSPDREESGGDKGSSVIRRCFFHHWG